MEALAIFIIIFSAFIAMFIGFLMGTDSKNDPAPLMLLCLILGAMLMFVGIEGLSEVNRDNGYKQGQIDALSGKNIQYELQVQPDSSKIWVKKDGD